MGTVGPPRKKVVVETGLEPHFHVTEFKFEHSADGNVICYAYEEVRGELRLQYTALMTGTKLVEAARQAMQAGSESHNMSIWRDDETTNH